MKANNSTKIEIEKNLESNIWKLYIIKGLRWFMVIMPILVLFFQENGLSMKEVLLLQAIFSIGIVLFEVPSGYFADVIGKRASLIAGCIIAFLGFSVYSFSYGFWGFLIAELILGLGSSFISGADSALIYDSLLSVKKEGTFKKIAGRYDSIGNFSEGFASIVGGVLASMFFLRAPMYLETIIAFLAIPIAFSLVEPTKEKEEKRENPFRDILKIVKYSLHDHAEVKWLIIYSALTGAGTLTAVWFLQPYMESSGLPLVLFGIVWAAFQFSTGFFSLSAEKYESTLGRKKALVSIIVLIALAYVLMGTFNSIFAIAFIFLFYFARGVSGPIYKDYINKIIESRIRATVLSVKNLVGRLIFSIIGPIIGWLSDTYTLRTALIVAGVTYLILGVVTLLFLKKNDAL